MDLQIHLGERLMHVLHVLCRHLDQLLAVAHDGTYGTDLIFGPEGSTQQSHRVQELNPLAFMPVGAAAGNILHVPGIDDARPETSLVEDFVQWNPVNAGRFHRCGSDAAALQPIGEAVKIFGESAEAAHWLVIRIVVHRHENLSGADIDSGRAGLLNGAVAQTKASVSFSGHVDLLQVSGSQIAWQCGTLLMGIEPETAISVRNQ
jgi:hypothetical protein